MIRLLAVVGLLLIAAPAFAGICLSHPDGVHCSDAGETLILQGMVVAGANQTAILQKDGQGNTFGLIGGEKLMIVRAQGMTAAKLGAHRLICVEAGPGVTTCRSSGTPPSGSR